MIVAYQIYAQVYGLAELKKVNVNVIPDHMRATSRERSLGDIEITQSHKEAVNYALQNPNIAPGQQARDAAVLEPLG